jgi:hypothetical protein
MNLRIVLLPSTPVVIGTTRVRRQPELGSLGDRPVSRPSVEAVVRDTGLRHRRQRYQKADTAAAIASRMNLRIVILLPNNSDWG